MLIATVFLSHSESLKSKWQITAILSVPHTGCFIHVSHSKNGYIYYNDATEGAYWLSTIKVATLIVKWILAVNFREIGTKTLLSSSQNFLIVLLFLRAKIFIGLKTPRIELRF